jgi:hypothetical protein
MHLVQRVLIDCSIGTNHAAAPVIDAAYGLGAGILARGEAIDQVVVFVAKTLLLGIRCCLLGVAPSTKIVVFPCVLVSAGHVLAMNSLAEFILRPLNFSNLIRIDFPRLPQFFANFSNSLQNLRIVSSLLVHLIQTSQQIIFRCATRRRSGRWGRSEHRSSSSQRAAQGGVGSRAVKDVPLQVVTTDVWIGTPVESRILQRWRGLHGGPGANRGSQQSGNQLAQLNSRNGRKSAAHHWRRCDETRGHTASSRRRVRNSNDIPRRCARSIDNHGRSGDYVARKIEWEIFAAGWDIERPPGIHRNLGTILERGNPAAWRLRRAAKRAKGVSSGGTRSSSTGYVGKRRHGRSHNCRSGRTCPG